MLLKNRKASTKGSLELPRSYDDLWPYKLLIHLI